SAEMSFFFPFFSQYSPLFFCCVSKIDDKSSETFFHYQNQAGFVFKQPGFFEKKIGRKTKGKKENF
ncbi:hypothetical protein, partial [Escherichia coli]|uniref:hypothetical protein n=1 Tax=Escherichia coli TaxID=562 RepID=UPI001BC830A0